MRQEAGSSKQEVGKGAPVRGTQSFVGVMAEIWKRPGLVGLEIGWRCVLWLPLFAVMAVAMGSMGMDVHWNPGPLAGATWFKPAEAVVLFGEFLKGSINAANGKVVWSQLLFTAGFALLWTSIATVFRGIILLRLNRDLKARWNTLWVLQVLRFGAAGILLLLWSSVCAWCARTLIARPFAAGGDPNVVLAFAVVVVWTLVLFVLWCVVGWIFQAAPLASMKRGLGVAGSLRDAWRSGPLRGKLIEINLVMGIVKVCLIVLALVFSACPLPFSDVETQTFLNWWWLGVFIFWVVASDYFHVVRAAAYLRLWEAYRDRV